MTGKTENRKGQTMQMHFHERTPQAVRNILEAARSSGGRLRVFYGDTGTGRDWGEENDVTGYIGRSTGPQRVPLMLANSRSHGGSAILDHCIVRIVRDGRDVYKHPRYNQPDYVIYSVSDGTMRAKGYQVQVVADGDVVARFKSIVSARRWQLFMLGKRMTK